VIKTHAPVLGVQGQSATWGGEPDQISSKRDGLVTPAVAFCFDVGLVAVVPAHEAGILPAPGPPTARVIGFRGTKISSDQDSLENGCIASAPVPLTFKAHPARCLVQFDGSRSQCFAGSQTSVMLTRD
jgi:hypothetical protein